MANTRKACLLGMVAVSTLLIGCEDTPPQTNTETNTPIQPPQNVERGSKPPLLLTPSIKLAQDHTAPGAVLDIKATVDAIANVNMQKASIRFYKNGQSQSETPVLEKEIPGWDKESLHPNDSLTTHVSVTAPTEPGHYQLSFELLGDFGQTESYAQLVVEPPVQSVRTGELDIGKSTTANDHTLTVKHISMKQNETTVTFEFGPAPSSAEVALYTHDDKRLEPVKVHGLSNAGDITYTKPIEVDYIYGSTPSTAKSLTLEVTHVKHINPDRYEKDSPGTWRIEIPLP